VPSADRHPFVSIFLILYFLDALLGLGAAAGYLTSRSLFDPDALLPLAGPFGLALLLGAMVEVTLAFTRNMRWSARWIGLFVIAAQFGIQSVAILFISLGALPQGAPQLSDRGEGFLLLGLNLLQLTLGIWAAWDLSRGHFRPRRSA